MLLDRMPKPVPNAMNTNRRPAGVEFERVQEIPTGNGGGITTINQAGQQAPRANVGGGGGFGGN